MHGYGCVENHSNSYILMSSLVTIANLETKVPFYQTSNVLQATAADADIRKGTSKKSPATYFQESNKNHADTLTMVKLAEIVSFFNPRKKSKHENEAKFLAQHEKLVITNPGEKKGEPHALTSLYKSFSAVGVNNSDLKVNL